MANHLSPYHKANNTWISERCAGLVIGDFGKKLTRVHVQFYEDKETGDKKPGKKGVSLAVDEVNTSSQTMILVR
jgi:hypothetical protein